MRLRDEVETALRAWDGHEVGRGADPVIDYDFAPPREPEEPAGSRLEIYRRLQDLRAAANDENQPRLVERIDCHLAYLRALMGERQPLDAYVRATQGCPAAGWPDEYVREVGNRARKTLDALGISWGPNTDTDLDELEGRLPTDEAPDAIRQASNDLEQLVRSAAGTKGEFNLTIEVTNTDAYWAYWTDGVGSDARLRLNLRHARFTPVRVRQFALHEVLGHALQGASLAHRCAHEDVDWVRILCVHAHQQVLFEGLAQALPLIVLPNDTDLAARVRLDHYAQLVRAELHLALAAGWSVDDCAAHARDRVPFWSDAAIGDALADRGANPMLRSYLWSYPAGADWFINLADTAAPAVVDKILHTVYQEPATPADLAELWPAGPPIGGPGAARPPSLPST